ncbi:site-specific recombinase [Massilia horti]|uniref:Recombinase n=1 Tax=Massilia horti TaxID=2562153 RepID=A0A4Y9SY44_9BURK|nr:site-specific recombinase [Massilia horti]TFW31658.1 recombinase [Massilia horti]
MLAVLERIDPHSDRIDLLVDLVECLRPHPHWRHDKARQAVRTLCQLLKGNQAQAWALRCYMVTLLETRRHTSLYSDIGILSNDGFFTELKRRISYRFLPPAYDDRYLSQVLNQVLYRDTDFQWIRAVPNADWLELFDVVAGAEPPPGAAPNHMRFTTLMGLLDAIRTLSCRVCALGLEPLLVHSYSEIEDFDSPFLVQNIEINKYLDEYGRYLDGLLEQMEDAKHVLVMLDQCEEVVAKIRKGALSTGTSVALTYLLVALTQSIDRLRKLLFLVDIGGQLPSAPTLDLEAVANDATPPSEPPASPHRAAAIALAQELIEGSNTKYQVRGLFRDNIDLLARNVTENASRTGEHYIAENRSQLRKMFTSSAGAGLVVGFMAMIKILLAYLKTAPLVEAFLFSLNYSAGFILVHLLHWTIATKQPAMTAQRIAAGLHRTAGRGVDIDRMAELVNKVLRTQIVAVLGNLATVIPVAFLIAFAYPYITGHHLVNPAKALHMIHESDPLHSPALFHAAIAGVWLFVSGLVSGYYDNKALYTRVGQRVRQLRGLRRVLGQARLQRLSVYIENNLGGLMGNLYFGILMGVTGTVGFLLGLPLDIRHVTFSAANFAIALVGLNYQVSWDMVATTLVGIVLIGAVNLLVSFGLALWVALRARHIRFRHGVRLLRAMGRSFASAPLDFFIGSKAVPAKEPAAAPERGTK